MPPPNFSNARKVDSALQRGKSPTKVHQTEPHDEVPYSAFTRRERFYIVTMVALAGMFSPLTANIYFPAIPTIASAFRQSVENINLTVTVYMILQGLSPSLWGSIADRKGRRISFLLCLLILALSCVGLALCPTSAYWLLMLLRCIQAAGSASTIALSAGVMADIVPAKDRGGYIGISNIGPMIGPCIGPVIGGLLSDNLGWRSIFWFLAIAAGVSFVAMLLFFPETLRSLVGNGSIPAPRWDQALIPVIGRSSLEITSDRPPPRPLPNPFKLFTYPDLCILLFSSAIPYCAFYAVTATLSSLFEDTFPNLSESEIGVCFLGVGLGGITGTVSSGKLLDRQYRFIKKQFERTLESNTERAYGNEKGERDSVNNIDRKDFPIEKARMLLQQLWIGIFSASTIGYGWVIQSEVTIAVPLILQFIIGYTVVAIMTSTQTLIVDLFPTQGSSVTAANNLVRCLLGAGTVSIITIVTDALKPGWTYTICGGICILTSPLIVLEMRMGPTWRKRRTDAN